MLSVPLSQDDGLKYSIKYVGVSGGNESDEGEMGILSRRVAMPKWGEHLLHSGDRAGTKLPAGIKFDPDHPEVRERRETLKLYATQQQNRHTRPTTASMQESGVDEYYHQHSIERPTSAGAEVPCPGRR